METRYLVPVYAVYAAVTLALTIFLARTLSRNGAVFLEDVFKDNPKLGDAVNRLLVVGFYLVNLGYGALIMKATGAATVVEAVEVLAWKLGALLMSLAFMHFVNLYVFYRIRRRSPGALRGANAERVRSRRHASAMSHERARPHRALRLDVRSLCAMPGLGIEATGVRADALHRVPFRRSA